MTFNLIFFICFSFVVIFLYHTLAKKYSNIFLFIVSMFFYLLIDYRHTLLLVISVVVTYYLTEITKSFVGIKRRVVSWMAIFFVISMLAFYKYFANTFNHFDFAIDIIMPIGISYFSFKMISYIVDIGLKGETGKNYSLLEYAVYISLFSQIVSGPITRISEFEFGSGYNKISKEEIAVNIRLIISGMFKKLVIAERLAIYTDYSFSNFETMPTIALWINMFFYSIQIYCDFCGYSEIAIGITRMFGLHCDNNFRLPYFSLTIKEFWNRWHISLSHWLRDYIYIPLGGSKNGEWEKVRNTMIVFGISGIWHGSTWNYLIWGFWHGIFQSISPRKEFVRHKTGKYLCHIGTLVIVSVGWIFFYYSNVKNAFVYLGNMCKGFDISINSIILTVMPFTQDYACFAHLGVVSIMIFILFLYERCKDRSIRYDYWLEMYIYVVSIVLFGVFGQNNFIYANF